MKRRLLSFALCFIMVLTAVVTASCGKDTDAPDAGEDNSRAKTLSIWGIKGEGTTDEAIAAVEAAMSKITKTKYNTAIELNLYFEDEYYDALDERFEEMQIIADEKKAAEEERKRAEREAKKKGETLAKEDETKAYIEETTLDEYGLPTTLYPEVEDDQLDIFLVTDYEMLTKYEDLGYLSAIDTQISGSSKLIKSFVHPTLMSAGVISDKTVAIINQQLLGEATYMLVNRELLSKYYYHIDDIADNSARNSSLLLNVENFILDVKREEPDYMPFVGDPEPVNVMYFTMNGEKSIFGNMIAPEATRGTEFDPRHMLFENPRYTKYLKTYMTLKNAGCFASETFTPEDKFGVGIMKGTLLDVRAYEENYHILTVQAPQATTENIYNGMFCVSSFTKDIDRAVEILEHLNTKSDLRNLFGYGIEGTHYTIDKDGVLDVISEDYNMKLEYTGNAFVAHAPEGEPADYWTLAREHNLGLVLSPFFGFELTEDMVDMELYNWAIEFSGEFFAELDKVKTDDEFDELLDKWSEMSDESDEANLWVELEPQADEEGAEPPKTLGLAYRKWFARNVE